MTEQHKHDTKQVEQRWGSEFHARDGWYFSRNADGCVRITNRRNVSTDVRHVIAEVEVDADTWCSIIASMTPTRETSATFQAARDLHGGRVG